MITTRSIIRTIRCLTAREPMSETDTARALALAVHLDPSSRSYEIALAACTGIRCDPSMWRGGRVNGDGHGDGSVEPALSAGPDELIIVSDGADSVHRGVGQWHGTVPTGRPVQAATVRPALATAWAMATDERVSMPVQRWTLVQAIGFGLVQAQTGRVLLSRVADVIGATGARATQDRAARAALDDARMWVGGMIGRAVREACTVRPARPRVLASGIVSGRLPAACTPDLPSISTGTPTLTRAQRTERAQCRREARAARVAYADICTCGTVVTSVGVPRPIAPHVQPRPVATPGMRYRMRLRGAVPVQTVRTAAVRTVVQSAPRALARPTTARGAMSLLLAG